MTSPSTIGERRGLIILLALILITAIVSAVISSVTPSGEQPLPACVTDTISIPAEKSCEHSDSSAFSRKKRSKKSAEKSRKKSPVYRSPLDEPVTP
ncbi:MAG: hypothetical protein K2K47_10410 [Duncaniella sp.]|nr:hypothetical protein [Duncaniella sp.]